MGIRKITDIVYIVSIKSVSTHVYMCILHQSMCAPVPAQLPLCVWYCSSNCSCVNSFAIGGNRYYITLGSEPLLTDLVFVPRGWCCGRYLESCPHRAAWCHRVSFTSLINMCFCASISFKTYLPIVKSFCKVAFGLAPMLMIMVIIIVIVTLKGAIQLQDLYNLFTARQTFSNMYA